MDWMEQDFEYPDPDNPQPDETTIIVDPPETNPLVGDGSAGGDPTEQVDSVKDGSGGEPGDTGGEILIASKDDNPNAGFDRAPPTMDGNFDDPGNDYNYDDGGDAAVDNIIVDPVENNPLVSDGSSDGSGDGSEPVDTVTDGSGGEPGDTGGEILIADGTVDNGGGTVDNGGGTVDNGDGTFTNVDTGDVTDQDGNMLAQGNTGAGGSVDNGDAYAPEWQDNGDGTFTQVGTGNVYSADGNLLSGAAGPTDISALLAGTNGVNIDPLTGYYYDDDGNYIGDDTTIDPSWKYDQNSGLWYDAASGNEYNPDGTLAAMGNPADRGLNGGPGSNGTGSGEPGGGKPSGGSPGGGSSGGSSSGEKNAAAAKKQPTGANAAPKTTTNPIVKLTAGGVAARPVVRPATSPVAKAPTDFFGALGNFLGAGLTVVGATKGVAGNTPNNSQGNAASFGVRPGSSSTVSTRPAAIGTNKAGLRGASSNNSVAARSGKGSAPNAAVQANNSTATVTVILAAAAAAFAIFH